MTQSVVYGVSKSAITNLVVGRCTELLSIWSLDSSTNTTANTAGFVRVLLCVQPSVKFVISCFNVIANLAVCMDVDSCKISNWMLGISEKYGYKFRHTTGCKQVQIVRV